MSLSGANPERYRRTSSTTSRARRRLRCGDTPRIQASRLEHHPDRGSESSRSIEVFLVWAGALLWCLSVWLAVYVAAGALVTN
jgi:hypothetical protein